MGIDIRDIYVTFGERCVYTVVSHHEKKQMTRKEVKDEIQQQIRNAENGLQSENPKFDFKFKWYDLSQKDRDYYELIKDCSAMANSIGNDGIIAIGYDDKRCLYNESKITSSGKLESLEIYKILGGNIVEMFDINIYEERINDKIFSVLHIPNSISKPHLIKDYKRNWKDGESKVTEKNKIFIRKDTGTKEANKYDIDLMYIDRKNIIPDYLLYVDAIKIDFGNYSKRKETIQFVIFFSIENLGKRPVAISDITLQARLPNHTVEFKLEGKVTQVGLIAKHSAKDLIIKSGELKYINELVFTAPGTLKSEDKRDFIADSEFWAVLQLVNNKKLNVRINHE